MDFRINPGGSLTGVMQVPGDKSISHRAVILGAIADGVTDISGLLQSADVLASVVAMRAMGVAIDGPDQGQWRIHGVGIDGLSAPAAPLAMGNSGTAMRLMAGLLAGQPFPAQMSGDASLSRRPMRRVVDPLNRMGADIETTPEGLPPLVIRPVARLRGIDCTMEVASAQVKSALLLAALYAERTTVVREPVPTRDHTERMLRGFGVELGHAARGMTLRGEQRLTGTVIGVPGDISSAAFFLVGATLAPESDLTIERVGVNPTRTGILRILDAMGARIQVLNERVTAGEPVADLRVRSSRLRGIEVPAEWVPLAIDEFPALAIAAACANGRTVIRGASELRVKESDRIKAIVDGLTALGVHAEEQPDGMVIDGGPLAGGTVASCGDHRIAMAFAMAGLIACEQVTVRDCANVSTSFPDFVALAQQAGLQIRG